MATYNNIYDEICYLIDDYRDKNHIEPNILYMGTNKYNELEDYCKRIGIKPFGKKIKNCEIRFAFHDMLYVAYDMSYETYEREREKEEQKKKDELVKKLLFSYTEEREITSKVTDELSEQMDNDINDLHKFLEFEHYYDRWTEKKGGDK